MQARSGRPLAYSNAIVNVGNSSRSVVRFVCVDCTHELELANNDPRKHAPFFAQQARKRGWDTDGLNSRRVFCPDCRKTPASRPRRQVELDSVVLPALEPPVIEGTCVQLRPRVFESVTEAVDFVVEQAAMPRDLSNDQRRQIRLLLDQYFDDKDGCYLAGDNGELMSDQAIGVMAGVPWAEVTRIREASYGRIMVDPALAILRKQMDELHHAVQEQLAILEQRMTQMRLALDGYGQKQARAS